MVAIPFLADAAYRRAEQFSKQRNYEAEIKWLGRAARLGHPQAQYNYGLYHYIAMHGVKKDEALTRKWVKKSAKGGCAEAQKFLAELYDFGMCGVLQNPDKARKLYAQAAKHRRSSEDSL